MEEYNSAYKNNSWVEGFFQKKYFDRNLNNNKK